MTRGMKGCYVYCTAKQLKRFRRDKIEKELDRDSNSFLIFYLIPTTFPTFFCLPDLVVGIPISLAIFLFADENSKALLQLKDNPGIILFLP